MRVTLADASLARYAGRFVWLELDFDKRVNRDFLVQHAIANTPTFFILDPSDEHVVATQISAMTLTELRAFLDRGERAVISPTCTPADAALARADRLLAGHRHAEAAAAYREALRLAPTDWPERDETIASLAWALKSDRQWRPCAEVAAKEAPRVQRTATFGRVVLAGMWCANMGEPEAWADSAAKTLAPLAEEAVALPSSLRDHRFQLYQNLMYLADSHHDHATEKKWGELWLGELDATNPANDDERSALDVARVDVESILGEPARVIPALIASESAMPINYNASLRLAQMESAAGHYDDAIAACDRGLRHVSGPLGKAWLLETKAVALTQKGRTVEARRALEEARRSALDISLESPRKNNLSKIDELLRKLQKSDAQERQNPN
ncbi:MAG TPA: thioredoxin family protein [Terriglobia bacterium]|nr:thioredoxin family protein [Terriglobia bacterium]